MSNKPYNAIAVMRRQPDGSEELTEITIGKIEGDSYFGVKPGGSLAFDATHQAFEKELEETVGGFPLRLVGYPDLEFVNDGRDFGDMDARLETPPSQPPLADLGRKAMAEGKDVPFKAGMPWNCEFFLRPIAVELKWIPAVYAVCAKYGVEPPTCESFASV